MKYFHFESYSHSILKSSILILNLKTTTTTTTLNILGILFLYNFVSSIYGCPLGWWRWSEEACRVLTPTLSANQWRKWEREMELQAGCKIRRIGVFIVTWQEKENRKAGLRKIVGTENKKKTSVSLSEYILCSRLEANELNRH